jgi:hypothetical protein
VQTLNDVNQTGLWDVDEQLAFDVVDQVAAADDAAAAALIRPRPDDELQAALWSAACGEAVAAAAAAETGWPYFRCEVCYRRRGKCLPGHTYRAPGTPRPRGEIRLPAGALVQIMGGPDRQAIGALGIVTEVESPTMRHVSLGRFGAPSFDLRIGLRGLRLHVGKDSVN